MFGSSSTTRIFATEGSTYPRILARARMVPSASRGQGLVRAGWSSYRLLLGHPVRQPVEGHSRRPRLVVGAKGLARERLVILAEESVRELREGAVLEPYRHLPFSRAFQRPPQQPVHHGPHGTAPVAARAEAPIIRAGARRERFVKVWVACEGGRLEHTEEGLQAFWISGTGDERCEACDGAGLEVEVEAETEFGVPTFVQPFSPAFDPGSYHRPVFLWSTDDFGRVEQRLVRLDKDRASQRILGQKRARPLQHGIVTAGLLDDLDQPDKAVVLLTRRTLRRVGDVLQIQTFVVGDLPDLDPLQRGCPTRRVVGATLPRVVDGHESGVFRVAGCRQVAVPGEELRIGLAEERPGLGAPLVPCPGDLEYVARRDRMHRWLAQAAGKGRTGRGIRGIRGARPVLGAREVALGGRLGVEDDVWDLTVLPLVLEQGPELSSGPTRIQVRQPYGYKGGVPAPLVRVERGRSASPPFHVVLSQHRRSPRDDIFGSQRVSFPAMVLSAVCSRPVVLAAPSANTNLYSGASGHDPIYAEPVSISAKS